MPNEPEQAPDFLPGIERARRESYHDIRASLAIIDGFCTALNISFNDLLLLNKSGSAGAQHDSNTNEQILELEEDCTFHLSRLVRAVEQLKVRLDASQHGSDDSLRPFDTTTE